MPAHGASRLRHVRFAGAPVDAPVPPVRPDAIVDASTGVTPVRGRAVAPQGFAAWLLARAGLDPSDYRAEPLDRRVPACLRALSVGSEAAAQARIEADPTLLQTALDLLLIGVTDFFRDTEVFEALQQVVLPALGAEQRPLRVWSVGCSTGAELHSVAILLAEAGLLDRATLVGSDCRVSAIEAARLGRYPEASLACVPSDLRDRYFTRDGDERQLAEEIRGGIDWRLRDVLFATEPGPWDLVLCRNVTIYLAPNASRRVTDAAAAALARGGFIVVGRAERLPADGALAPIARCVYQRGA